MTIFYGLQTSIFAGLLRPAASILFTVEDSETPVTIWADDQLTVPLPNPLQADSGGRWPPIYLSHLITYRVRLYDAAGTLLREANPYIPDPPIRVQPLADDGSILPACRLTFWRSQTDQLQPIYETPALDTELPNPLTADGTGTFSAVYLDPDLPPYRVRLETAEGVLRYDVDPYLPPSGVSYLTSRPYDTETIEALTSVGEFRGEAPSALLIEAIESTGAWISGSIGNPLRTYTDGLPEALETSGDWIDGELREALRTYTDGAPEALETSGDWTAGELREALRTYTHYPAEAIETSGAWIAGSFS